MEATQIIIKPLVTEKNTFNADAHNRVAFQVDRRADKGQIKRAVQELYKVRVVSVATKIDKGSRHRNRFGFFRDSDVKQAIVKVHPEDKIELF
jgi:large subunit ribosomal protein L23